MVALAMLLVMRKLTCFNYLIHMVQTYLLYENGNLLKVQIKTML